MLKLDITNQSDRSTDTPRSLTSDDDNLKDIITFQKKNLRKIAPNIYEIINKKRVIKISKHECFDMGCFDGSSSEDEIDEDDFEHSDKCSLLEYEFEITRILGQKEGLIHYSRFYKNIMVNGIPCCALEMPIYLMDFCDKYMHENQGNELNVKKTSSDNQQHISQMRQSLKYILNALDFMHENKISHNDIKPENILLTENENQPILIDLEFCQNQMQKQDLQKDQIQQWEYRDLTYCAPEVYEMIIQHNNEQSKVDNQQISNNFQFDEFKNDVFSLCCTFFALIFKITPRNYNNIDKYNPNDKTYQTIIQQNQQSLKQRIQKFNPEILQQKDEICEQESQMLDFFIKGMDSNVQKRFSTKQLLKHPWMQF